MQSLCSAAGYWPSPEGHAQTLPGDEETAAQLPAWQPALVSCWEIAKCC